jgi:GNAT superfamily N-acetyltransferase
MPLSRYGATNLSSDQRNAFDCGHDSLNRWLATQARQGMDSRDAVTQLLMEDEVIAGYYRLSAGSFSKAQAPPELAKRAPGPIPVIQMGRFAIGHAYHGQGWGADLLAEAIRSATASLDVIGAHALFVDAIDEPARRFYVKHGFAPSPIAPMQRCVRLVVARISEAAAHAHRHERYSEQPTGRDAPFSGPQ